ncbi:MAG: VOC family protein [Deltaproteobacteria bacterium]|nr:VOC family protein [Candidatus Zymogenaceae bacterium]
MSGSSGNTPAACHVHHVHLFASNVDESIAFYREVFCGEVALDMELAGARNVFIAVGAGRIHLYDQPPKDSGRGGIHHFGIQTNDIEAVIQRLTDRGVTLRKGVTDFGVWKYVMVPAPNDVLIELFEVDRNALPEQLKHYFL